MINAAPFFTFSAPLKEAQERSAEGFFWSADINLQTSITSASGTEAQSLPCSNLLIYIRCQKPLSTFPQEEAHSCSCWVRKNQWVHSPFYNFSSFISIRSILELLHFYHKFDLISQEKSLHHFRSNGARLFIGYPGAESCKQIYLRWWIIQLLHGSLIW